VKCSFSLVVKNVFQAAAFPFTKPNGGQGYLTLAVRGLEEFFPVVLFCQFFGCGGKWFLVLLPYLEYYTYWHKQIGILWGQRMDR
jgi:hypothetical protein